MWIVLTILALIIIKALAKSNGEEVLDRYIGNIFKGFGYFILFCLALYGILLLIYGYH
jgi:hypothetical protein